VEPWSFRAYADHRRVLGAGPVAVKEVEAQLLRLNAIIEKTPGITNPVGFSIETSGDLSLGDNGLSARAREPALTVRPLPASMGFGAFPVTEYGSGDTAKRSDTGETPHVYFFVNQLRHPLESARDSSVPEFEKLDADVVRLAAPQPDVFGLPRFGSSLVIKKSDAPIWIAVTFAETLDLVARGIEQHLTEQRDAVARVQAAYDNAKDPKKREERLAQHRKVAAVVKDPTFMEKMTKVEDEIARRAGKEFLPNLTIVKEAAAKSEQGLASVRTMAAGLSAADKAAPACYASRDTVSISRFRRAPSSGCDPLVRPNWKLFNPALPRTAPQVLTVWNWDQCLVPDRRVLHVGGCEANKRLLESIDKAALLAWLQ